MSKFGSIFPRSYGTISKIWHLVRAGFTHAIFCLSVLAELEVEPGEAQDWHLRCVCLKCLDARLDRPGAGTFIVPGAVLVRVPPSEN